MDSDHKNDEKIEHSQSEQVDTQKQADISSCEKEDVLVDQKTEAETMLWREQCVRISAEFENYKKRIHKEQVQWIEHAQEKILKDLVGIVDNFERALQQESVDIVGIEMIYQSLLKLLTKYHVTVMKEYKEFNPEFHEAVMQVASNDHKSGEIVDTFSKGFMIKDRVLRPAKVSVAQ